MIIAVDDNAFCFKTLHDGRSKQRNSDLEGERGRTEKGSR